MFSGLIQHSGSVVEVRRLASGGVTLLVAAPLLLREEVALGDSIAINGVCLTVTAWADGVLWFDVIPESLQRSTLGTLEPKQGVNLELSLRFGDRLGGHLVYAHVDTRVRVIEKAEEGQGFRVTLERPAKFAPYLVEKGYVALDGVSLTIASVTREYFTIALIPETAQRTTFAQRQAGSFVNLEIDPIARYVRDQAVAYMEASA